VRLRDARSRWLRLLTATLAPLLLGLVLGSCGSRTDTSTPDEVRESSTSSIPSARPSASEPLPNSYLDYVAQSAARKQLRSLCPTLEAIVLSSESRIDKADALLDSHSGNDPFEAQEFVRKNRASDFKDRFGSLDAAVTTAARKSLRKLSTEAAARTLMTKQYTQDGLSECKLRNRLMQARAEYGTIASKWASIEGLAASVPWHPRGFYEYRQGLAYRFVEGGSDPCYASCSYWTIEVISQDGCRGGLYAEMNISQGNRVVDWTNDTLPRLGPGQIAQLQMVTYSSAVSSGSTGELVTLRCND